MRGKGRVTCDEDEFVASNPSSAVEFDAFVVPESKTQVIPPNTWDKKSSSCDGR